MAVLALVVGLITAIATPAYWTLLASPERLRWTLVGAGVDGRSVLITTTAEGGTCLDGDLPHARLERDGSDEIRVRVVQHRPVGPSDALHPLRGYACAGVGLGRSTFEVQLERPVNGRRITGPGYRPKLATRVGIWSYRGSRATLGRVVGLRLDDARRVLRSYGIVRPVVSGPADDDAVVTAQDPEPGSALPRRPSSWRRTFDPRLTARLTVRARDDSR